MPCRHDWCRSAAFGGEITVLFKLPPRPAMEGTVSLDAFLVADCLSAIFHEVRDAVVEGVQLPKNHFQTFAQHSRVLHRAWFGEGDNITLVRLSHSVLSSATFYVVRTIASHDDFLWPSFYSEMCFRIVVSKYVVCLASYRVL